MSVSFHVFFFFFPMKHANIPNWPIRLPGLERTLKWYTTLYNMEREEKKQQNPLVFQPLKWCWFFHPWLPRDQLRVFCFGPSTLGTFIILKLLKFDILRIRTCSIFIWFCMNLSMVVVFNQNKTQDRPQWYVPPMRFSVWRLGSWVPNNAVSKV